MIRFKVSPFDTGIVTRSLTCLRLIQPTPFLSHISLILVASKALSALVIVASDSTT